MFDTPRVAHLLGRLRRNEQRGSKPRCHFLTHGAHEEVARRLTLLVADPRVQVGAADKWMPIGFDATEEPQLHTAARLIASAKDRDSLKYWWLAEPRPTSRTPTWDIVSTCSIDGARGLLLIEGKAHYDELINETCGKRVVEGSSRANHLRIGCAIAEANEALRLATKLDWHLSSARCYQMSNRFAWAWKVCTLGYHVALVYLGFIGATEMRKPFSRDVDWHDLVKQHSAPLFPPEVWGQSMDMGGVILLPLIRTSPQLLH